MAKNLKISGIAVLFILIVFLILLLWNSYLRDRTVTVEECLAVSGRVVTLEDQAREGGVKGKVIGNISGTQDGRICVVENKD